MRKKDHVSDLPGHLPQTQTGPRLEGRPRPGIPRAAQVDEDYKKRLESMATAETIQDKSVVISQELNTIEQARLSGILHSLMREGFPGNEWLSFRTSMYDWVRGPARYIVQATPRSLERLIERLKEIRRKMAQVDVTPMEAAAMAKGQLSFEWPETQNPQHS